MKIWHMNGAGNDFMVLDARGMEMDFAAEAVRLCAITGADGFMAADRSEEADFRLHFYNSDGSRGEMCGNGARCICRFAREHGIAGDRMTIQTDAGLVFGQRLSETQYRVQMPLPTGLDLRRKADVAYVEVGCPHAIRAYAGDPWADKEALRSPMQALRFDTAFPKGANVNFYARLTPDRARLLTFERGVEDFTLACGTGSCALATVLWAQNALPGGRLTVENPGGELTVEIQAQQGRLTALYLEGPTAVTRMYDSL